MKDIVILGGPNGAGKTTAAREILPQKIEVSEFVNADELAHALSPRNSQRAALAAGRIMLERMEELRRGTLSFAFETTCSGRSHARFLRQCKLEGWRVILLFLWLPSSEAAIARVEGRIRKGGHAIPPDVIVRRYGAGIVNMRQLYLPLADIAAIYDNSDKGRRLIAEQLPGDKLVVRDPACWSVIEGFSK
jgi:predicted ABC-type ATPase